MKNMKHLLAVPLLIVLSGALMGGVCDEGGVAEGLCGPCGTIANGDATITGNAELDGIFKAVGTLEMTTGSIQGNFDARVRALAEGVFGLDVEGMATADIVGEIEAAFDAQIKANIQGDISVKYQEPKCSANIDVAVSAQAQCEAKVDGSCSAEVKCDPGKLSFECSGKCEGSCSAECSVPSCTIKLEPGQANCSGSCSGSCSATLDVAAKCEGKCEGSCDGECSAYVENTEGEMECSGSCSGNCEGGCVVEGEAAAECTGECHGECKIEGPDIEASCEGELGCSGECSGECSGGCEGEVKAPKCEGKAECNVEASAKCEAQASAQASASLECTPPSLELDFNFGADLDASAKAELMAKLDKFKLEMIGIIQGMFELRALVDADYAAELGIDPPTVAIKGSVDAFVTALGNGEIELEAVGLLPCALPAFQAAGSILASLPGEMKATISAQLDVVAIIGL
ncbi:MAG: hypothetical protein GY847_03695 [Proteobacteria bacterium]|nr:hypothetical protein [Pseudomonadota bacterium]